MEATAERYSVTVTVRNAHNDDTSELQHKSTYAYRDDADATAEYIYDAGNEENGGIVVAVRVQDSVQDLPHRTVPRIDADGTISYEPDDTGCEHDEHERTGDYSDGVVHWYCAGCGIRTGSMPVPTYYQNNRLQNGRR